MFKKFSVKKSHQGNNNTNVVIYQCKMYVVYYIIVGYWEEKQAHSKYFVIYTPL